MLKQLKINKKGALKHSAAFIELCQAAQLEIQEVEQADVLQSLKTNTALLIDVRDLSELKTQGYIAGAYHISKGWLEADIHYLTTDLSARVVLYCGSGKRSLLAALQLQKMGYHNVSSMKGGFKAWQEQGLPLAQDVE